MKEEEEEGRELRCVAREKREEGKRKKSPAVRIIGVRGEKGRGERDENGRLEGRG